MSNSDKSPPGPSESRPPPPPPPPLSPIAMPYRRSGCLTALLIVIGVALLLPGLCALLIVGIDPRSTLNEATGVVILLVCLAVSAGGIVLIWAAVRRPSR